MTCIHCEAVDLPNLKEELGIPEQYSLFNGPYKIQLQVSFQERDLVHQIIDFDKLEGSQFNLICLKHFVRRCCSNPDGHTDGLIMFIAIVMLVTDSLARY